MSFPGKHRSWMCFRLFVWAIVFLGLYVWPTAVNAGTVKQNPVDLILYQLDVNDEHVFRDGTIAVDPALPIQEKLKLLLDEISRRHFSDRPPIKILRTEKTKDGFIVTINLSEPEQDFYRSKWYQSFQGSTGGQETFVQLVHTILQPDYPGFWFTGIKVFWNGQPIEELDHIDLEGIKYRGKMKKA